MFAHSFSPRTPQAPSVLTPETAKALYRHVKADLEARYAKKGNPVPLELANGPESLRASIAAIGKYIDGVEARGKLTFHSVLSTSY